MFSPAPGREPSRPSPSAPAIGPLATTPVPVVHVTPIAGGALLPDAAWTRVGADEALAYLRTHAVAAVLVDVPGDDAVALTRRLRAEVGSALPILVVDATSDAAIAAAAYEAGAIDCLQAPVPPAVLAAKLAVFVAMHAERMTSAGTRTRDQRDELVALASHELRTPISALLLTLESSIAGARAGAPPAELLRRLEAGLRQVQRLHARVEGILEVARLRTGTFSLDRERVELTEVVAAVAARHAPELARTQTGIQLRLSPAAGEWDARRLDMVFDSLLSNAAKFGRGRAITVEVEAEQGMAVVDVIDQGDGVDAADAARIFECFERSASLHVGGLGIGLFLAKSIVEAHGGTIGVTSERGRGARFRVRLPLPRVHALHEA